MHKRLLKFSTWHYSLGLVLTPTLVTLAVTGLIYLFKPQVEPVLYKKLLEVPPQKKTVTAQAQLDTALKAYPTARLASIIPSLGPGRSMRVYLKTPGKTHLTVYVNPHTAEIVGVQRFDRTLMQLAHDIHGTLLLGKFGEIVMESTALVAFLLIFSGFILWWPRGQKGWAGILWPRLSFTGRAKWREFHAVPAFYVSGLIILFLTTGLPWTGITGKLFAQIGAATNTGSPPGFGGSPYKSEVVAGIDPISLDRLVEISHERLPGVPSSILLPNKEDGAAVIRWKAPKPQDRAYIHVDMYTGQVIADYRWDDFGVIGKFILMAVALHEGTWFGVWNQILNSIVALGVLGLAVTGIVMWRKRSRYNGLNEKRT